MEHKTIQMENISLQFHIQKDHWQLQLPKSQTKVTDIRQMDLMLNPSESFVPIQIVEELDAFLISYPIDPNRRNWSQAGKLNKNDKLRLLCNIAKLESYLSTRLTFFLHPDNMMYDENLMPVIIYRGLRNMVPPFEMDEAAFLKQYKCLSIALFSKKYTFEQLYNGSLQNATDTEFERQISEINDLAQLKTFLFDSYLKEQKKTESTMELVLRKRFRLFKQLAIIMIIVSILLAAPLTYYGFVKDPYQGDLLDAHGGFLASDYGSVISTLEGTDPEDLPSQTKYILAYSYIQVENLSGKEKEVILKHVSLKSAPDYLVYWIYNGRGQFDESIDKAKYMDDPQLIMYGLIKKIEQAKNDPTLTGTERDEEVNALQDQLRQYSEDYNIDGDGAEQVEETTSEIIDDMEKQETDEEETEEQVETEDED
ncbi:type VII secretion protein EssB [Oceanobacillus saliphilus]|uniref:type VII secretion protein EssB n=1 Tax=Oceanobacillus saliphilus TaxID=2925834 RepID=UPI00201DC952|nr:type VII secretion protein EssB [Oceanobacillus saliphilus]